jgi:hypothetical protein
MADGFLFSDLDVLHLSGRRPAGGTSAGATPVHDDTADDHTAADHTADEGPSTSTRKKRKTTEVSWPYTVSDEYLAAYEHTQFPEKSLEWEKFERLKWVDMGQGGLICYESLTEVGLKDRAMDFIKDVDSPWGRLYDQDLPAYREISVEFLCTFKYNLVLSVLK